MTTLNLTLSHKELASIDCVVPGPHGSDYSSTINKLLGYPEGTFQQVGEPAYDGNGACLCFSFPNAVESDLETSHKRLQHRSVDEYLSAIISAKLN